MSKTVKMKSNDKTLEFKDLEDRELFRLVDELDNVLWRKRVFDYGVDVVFTDGSSSRCPATKGPGHYKVIRITPCVTIEYDEK